VSTHETVSPPTGIVPARFRPPTGASSARAVSLDGPWRFRLSPTVDTGVGPEDPGEGWDEIAVPGHWQLAGAPDAWPYGTPAYSNKLFPFPIEPPFVPTTTRPVSTAAPSRCRRTGRRTAAPTCGSRVSTPGSRSRSTAPSWRRRTARACRRRST
jgi:hypothetical protein